jgi:3-oxoacyl-[acyl-carrier-protein] synthase II
MTRIVITDAGVVSPLGTGTKEFLQGLHEGRRGVNRIRSFDTEFFPTALGAEVRSEGEVVASDCAVDRKESFIRGAVGQVISAGGIRRYAPEQRQLSLGAGIDYFDFLNYVRQRDSRPWADFSLRASRVVERLAQDFAIAGGHAANVAACVASTQAMGLALRLLRRAPDQAIVTGGFDSMLSHLHYMGFFNLGALSDWDGDPPGACRPFDRERRGLVIGEGAAAYLFEAEANADKAAIQCEVAGYGATMDAYMVTDPEPGGRMLAHAALAAIRDAGITPDDIDSVDLHGTGTVKNALAEARAMELVFPSRWRQIPVFALKGQIGHLIGACGAIEVLGVIDALKHQRVLPSVNCDEPDPELPLNIIRGEPLAASITHVLKLNAAFGGQNTALVFRKYG